MSKLEVPVVVEDVDEVGRGEREARQVRVVIVVKLCQTGKHYQIELTPLTLLTWVQMVGAKRSRRQRGFVYIEGMAVDTKHRDDLKDTKS